MNYYNRFAGMIKKAFCGRTRSGNTKLRDQIADLTRRKEKAYEAYVKPLSEELTILSRRLGKECEHPAESVTVKVEEWDSEDGEGNSWSGDTVRIACSCGLSHSVESTSDGSHQERFVSGYRSSYPRDLIELLNGVWSKLRKQESDEQARSNARYFEQKERRELVRLSRKYK
jgi:hypothetical protein